MLISGVKIPIVEYYITIKLRTKMKTQTVSPYIWILSMTRRTHNIENKMGK